MQLEKTREFASTDKAVFWGSFKKGEHANKLLHRKTSKNYAGIFFFFSVTANFHVVPLLPLKMLYFQILGMPSSKMVLQQAFLLETIEP